MNKIFKRIISIILLPLYISFTLIALLTATSIELLLYTHDWLIAGDRRDFDVDFVLKFAFEPLIEIMENLW